MREMIVRCVARQICKQVLDGMIDVVIRGDLCIVAVEPGFLILVRTVLCDFCGGEQGADRLEMKAVQGFTLLAARCVGGNGGVFSNACYNVCH